MDSEGSLTGYAHDLYSEEVGRRDAAALQLWLRFSGRLAAVVRRRLNAAILRRAGLDDVMQDLFAGFLTAGPGPNGPPRDRAELWRRLVRFTVFKVAGTAVHHRARRRDVRRERLVADFTLDGQGDVSRRLEFPDIRHPAPGEEAAAREELARLFEVLPENLRHVLALRIEGYSNAQIGEQIGRVERTVELKFRVIRALLRPHFAGVTRLDEGDLASARSPRRDPRLS